jgi:hypothetical protein
MRKYYFIILIVAATIVSVNIFFLIYLKEVAAWNGWNALSAISTFIASIGLFFVIFQLGLQKKSYNIDELNYVMSLTDKFSEANNKYGKAWNILSEYGEKIPKQMELEEWEIVVEALTDCYESAYLNFQVAQLVEHQIIDLKTFYMLQFNFLSNHPDGKLHILHLWIETGLDLAANYDHKLLLTMVRSAKKFYTNLYKMSKEDGVEGYDYQIKALSDTEKKLLENFDKYDITSPNYSIDKMVDIIDDKNNE